MDGPASVLVVDDEELNRELLGAMLEALGHTSVFAENGPEALFKVRGDVDLVLLDIMMPGMDGTEVLERLKADTTTRHLPVIIISALSDLEVVVRCIQLGAEDYLPKPFDRTLLKARIGASLDKKRMRDREVVYLRRIEEERQRADELLHVILPAQIVRELKANNSVRPRLHDNVAVLFCDLVEFTPYCEARAPDEVVSNLQRLVEVYERMTARHQMEKIKTLGDAFMATAGLLQPAENPALSAVRCGLEMLDAAPAVVPDWQVRVGIHVGPVIAGVVGLRQYLYDLWGDTVNTAARIESHGVDGCVNVSRAAWDMVAAHSHGASLGVMPVKGKGPMEFYRVDGLRAPATGNEPADSREP